MENTVNSRVLLLKKELGLSNNEFCLQSKISTSTLYSIQSGVDMKSKTITAIAEAFNINKDWLINGKGKMLNEKIKEISANPWKDALISELKEEVTYYRELLKMMAGNKAANFLKASENAYSFKMFPGMDTLKIVSGAKMC